MRLARFLNSRRRLPVGLLLGAFLAATAGCQSPGAWPWAGDSPFRLTSRDGKKSKFKGADTLPDADAIGYVARDANK